MRNPSRSYNPFPFPSHWLPITRGPALVGLAAVPNLPIADQHRAPLMVRVNGHVAEVPELGVGSKGEAVRR